MNPKLIEQLENRKKEGIYRTLIPLQDKVDFYSNDYLGLAKLASTEVFTEIYSGTGSRLISGSNAVNTAAEKKLAQHFNTEAALIYNSGYDANLGFFSCIPQKGDSVIYDEYIHASVRDGLRLSSARSFSFKHNDLEDLEKKLSISTGTSYVAVEGLYSMHGDLALLGPIYKLCETHGALLIVDEAHSAGIFGSDGKGFADAIAIKPFARIITYGKAFGSHGGSILGSSALIDYLVNFSRPFIYSTALPPESYLRISEMITHPLINYHRSVLQSKISSFRQTLKTFPSHSELNSPIQMLHLGDLKRTRELAEILQYNSFAVKPIYSPTVPVGQEGIRICIHSFNRDEDIIRLATLINQHI